MSGKVDIQVGIGADATPLEREVAKARGSVHGLARDVEKASKGMTIQPPAARGVAPSGAGRAAVPVVAAAAPADERRAPTIAPVTAESKKERRAPTIAPVVAEPKKAPRSQPPPVTVAAAPKEHRAPVAAPVVPSPLPRSRQIGVPTIALPKDVKVKIEADAKPLEHEVEKAQAAVHKLEKEVKESSKRMKIAPPPITGAAANVASRMAPTVTTGRPIPIPPMIERAPSARPERHTPGLGEKLVRRPEFNVMGRMEGLLGGLTLGGMLMWIRGAEDAAGKAKELARAAKLPTEEFVRLQQAAKANQIPVETLNAAIKDYSEGKITLQQVGEAVGIIGMKAGGASAEVKKLADQIDELAELDTQMKTVQEGMANFFKTGVVGLSKFMQQASRMAIESVAQGRGVSWWEAGDMMQGERERDKRQESAKMEKELREKRAVIKVEADLTDFFGDIERAAAEAEKKRVKIKAITEAKEESLQRITVNAPRAGDSLARIGGFMGGRMDNRGFMLQERQLRELEIIAKATQETQKVMAGS